MNVVKVLFTKMQPVCFAKKQFFELIFANELTKVAKSYQHGTWPNLN